MLANAVVYLKTNATRHRIRHRKGLLPSCVRALSAVGIGYYKGAGKKRKVGGKRMGRGRESPSIAKSLSCEWPTSLHALHSCRGEPVGESTALFNTAIPPFGRDLLPRTHPGPRPVRRRRCSLPPRCSVRIIGAQAQAFICTYLTLRFLHLGETCFRGRIRAHVQFAAAVARCRLAAAYASSAPRHKHSFARCRASDGCAANCHTGRGAHQRGFLGGCKGSYLASLSPPPSSAPYLNSKLINGINVGMTLPLSFVGHVRGADVHTFVTVPPLHN